MLSRVIPQCLVTDKIPIKLQLTGKSRLIFKFVLISAMNMSAKDTAVFVPIATPWVWR